MEITNLDGKPLERPVTVIDWTPEAAREGRLRPLHAQGDPRASRTPCASRWPAASPRPATSTRPRSGAGPRRGLPAGHARGARRPAGRRGTRRWWGPPRSQIRPACRAGSPWARSSGTRRRRWTPTRSSSDKSARDGRHHRADALGARAGLSDRRRDQYRGFRDHARGQRGAVPPGGPRDRGAGGVTQVTTLLVLAAAIAKARGSLGAEQGARAGARPPRAARCRARALERAAEAEQPGFARRYVNSRGFMFIGRSTKNGGPRGGARAQGGQLHPRRGVRGRRAQARPDLAARRGVPAGRRRDRDDGPYDELISNVMEGRARDARVIAVASTRGTSRSSARRRRCVTGRHRARRWGRSSTWSHCSYSAYYTALSAGHGR